MTCQYCHGISWILIKKAAPSPPYKEGQELEYAERCVCTYGTQKTAKSHEDQRY